MKFKTDKFRPELVKDADNIAGIILDQYPEWHDEYVNATDLYMPDSEQDKMAEWILANNSTLKKMNKKMAERHIAMMRLDIFPSSING